jgi:hypothetical protein
MRRLQEGYDLVRQNLQEARRQQSIQYDKWANEQTSDFERLTRRTKDPIMDEQETRVTKGPFVYRKCFPITR